MLCPNELGCTFSRYMIPRTNGETDHYEMFDGTFLVGDLCNFKVTNPVASDLNDVMYFKLEYVNRCKAVLIKGESISNPIALYRLAVGQSYTALKGINFYILFEATEETSGDFAFKIWYNNVSGYGESEPTVVTYEEDPRNPSDPDPEPEPEPEKPDETTDIPDKPDTTDSKDNTSDSTDTSDNTEKSDGTGSDIDPDDSNQEKIGDNTGDDDDEVTPDDSGNTDTSSDSSGGTNSDGDDGLNDQETIGGDTGTDTDTETDDNSE